MHVVESPSTLVPPFGSESEPIAKEHAEQALRMLSALVAPEDQDDLDLRIILKSGEIKDEITAVVREDRSDMVVMGTHGRGLFGRWVIGSITEGLLRNLSIPVLTVCHASRPLSIKRILFATDLSEYSKQGFDCAYDLARTTRSDLTVLHVVDPTTLSYGGAEMVQYVSQHHIEEARQRLGRFTAEGAPANVKVEPIVVEGDAAEKVLRAADETEADLILITIHKKGFVERALLGTIAERVVREAKIPVLCFPLTAREEGRISGSESTKAS